MGPAVDVETVAAAQAGDDAAFARLYDALAGEIYNHLLRLVGDGPLAEDLTHDAFVNAYRGLARLREVRALRGWLYRIATNLALNEMKRRRREETRELQHAPAALGSRLAELSRRDLIERVLARLTEEQRALLLVHLREGFELAEVAGMLGIPYQAAKQRLYRARQAFRREYERMGRAEAET